MHACVAVYSAAYIGSDGKSRKPEEAGSTAGQTLKLACVLFELKSVVRVFVCASPGPGLEEASCQARSGGRQGRQGKTCDFHDPEWPSSQEFFRLTQEASRHLGDFCRDGSQEASRHLGDFGRDDSQEEASRHLGDFGRDDEATHLGGLAGGLVNPSFCVETDLQEEDSGLEATWEACQGAEAAFQARKTKPEEPNQSPDKVSLSQETMVLGLYDPPITQSDFEQAMKDWPEEPDSYRDPSQEAEEEAPPGYLLVWDLLSPLQKWVIKQNPRVRDGLQPCGRPVSNSKSK